MTATERKATMLAAVADCERIVGELAGIEARIDAIPRDDLPPSTPMGWRLLEANRAASLAKERVESCGYWLERIAVGT